MNHDSIYLDHAAATPVDADVLAAMQPYFSDEFYNPSSPYAPAIMVRRVYEEAKQRIAACIGAKGNDIVMTAGATESINLMFQGVNGHVVTTTIEHAAVLEAAKRHEYSLVEVDAYGMVSPEAIAGAIRPDTVLVSVALANNELGTVQPIREIAEYIRSERTQRLERGDTRPIYLHTDASQGVGQLDVHIARMGVDAMTMNAAKLYGPKQVGLLWLASHVRLEPSIVGGGQERNLRSGTENVTGTVGFALALEKATSRRRSESQHLAMLRDTMQTRLMSEFPTAVVSGHPRLRLPGYLHISFPGLDAERLIFSLEARGVLVATGSACAANKGTRSHVLEAIGLAPEIADGSLRLTFGRLNDTDSSNRATGILIDVIRHEMARIQL